MASNISLNIMNILNTHQLFNGDRSELWKARIKISIKGVNYEL